MVEVIHWCQKLSDLTLVFLFIESVCVVFGVCRMNSVLLVSSCFNCRRIVMEALMYAFSDLLDKSTGGVSCIYSEMLSVIGLWSG